MVEIQHEHAARTRHGAEPAEGAERRAGGAGRSASVRGEAAGQADREALYSFARSHVVRARSIEHLNALAYFEPWAAAHTDKHSTLVVYRDRELLREALVALLEGEPCG